MGNSNYTDLKRAVKDGSIRQAVRRDCHKPISRSLNEEVLTERKKNQTTSFIEVFFVTLLASLMFHDSASIVTA